MRHIYEEEIRLELERSQKSLDAAKKLFEGKLFEDAEYFLEAMSSFIKQKGLDL